MEKQPVMKYFREGPRYKTYLFIINSSGYFTRDDVVKATGEHRNSISSSLSTLFRAMAEEGKLKRARLRGRTYKYEYIGMKPKTIRALDTEYLKYSMQIQEYTEERKRERKAVRAEVVRNIKEEKAALLRPTFTGQDKEPDKSEKSYLKQLKELEAEKEVAPSVLAMDEIEHQKIHHPNGEYYKKLQWTNNYFTRKYKVPIFLAVICFIGGGFSLMAYYLLLISEWITKRL